MGYHEANNKDLKEAQQLIQKEINYHDEKKEMLSMLHYDAINYPATNQVLGAKNKKANSMAMHVQYLNKHEYHEANNKDLKEAQQLIQKEINYHNEKQEMKMD